MAILREDLLDGRAVALSAGDSALREQLTRLGAAVLALDATDVPADAIVHAAAAAFAGGGAAALTASLEETWAAVSEVTNASLIPSGRGGKVVLIAPAADAGDFAGAACAALENLARTLSVEWARYGITVVAIAPGAGARAEDVALLVAYLLSPAGDYFSGCRLDVAAR